MAGCPDEEGSLMICEESQTEEASPESVQSRKLSRIWSMGWLLVGLFFLVAAGCKWSIIPGTGQGGLSSLLSLSKDSPKCPWDYEQLGSLGDDVAGWGLSKSNNKANNISDCRAQCDANYKCGSFEFVSSKKYCALNPWSDTNTKAQTNTWLPDTITCRKSFYNAAMSSICPPSYEQQGSTGRAVCGWDLSKSGSTVQTMMECMQRCDANEFCDSFKYKDDTGTKFCALVSYAKSKVEEQKCKWGNVVTCAKQTNATDLLNRNLAQVNDVLALLIPDPLKDLDAGLSWSRCISNDVANFGENAYKEVTSAFHNAPFKNGRRLTCWEKLHLKAVLDKVSGLKGVKLSEIRNVTFAGKNEWALFQVSLGCSVFTDWMTVEGFTNIWSEVFGVDIGSNSQVESVTKHIPTIPTSKEQAVQVGIEEGIKGVKKIGKGKGIKIGKGGRRLSSGGVPGQVADGIGTALKMVNGKVSAKAKIKDSTADLLAYLSAPEDDKICLMIHDVHIHVDQKDVDIKDVTWTWHDTMDGFASKVNNHLLDAAWKSFNLQPITNAIADATAGALKGAINGMKLCFGPGAKDD